MMMTLAKKYAPVKAMPFEFDFALGSDHQWCVCTKDSNLTGCDMDKEDAELFAYAINALATQQAQPPTGQRQDDGLEAKLHIAHEVVQLLKDRHGISDAEV